jgi:hypothetical protein
MRSNASRPAALRRLRLALFAVTLGLATNTTATEPPVALGEVSVSMPSKGPSLAAQFRATLERQFGESGLGRARPAKRLILSATLMELQTRSVNEATKTTCGVSAVLRQRDSGVLFAIARGRATAEQTHGRAAATEGVAMRAAVDGALDRLAAAVK